MEGCLFGKLHLPVHHQKNPYIKGSRLHMYGASNRIRTCDLFLTMEALYLLSYGSIAIDYSATISCRQLTVYNAWLSFSSFFLMGFFRDRFVSYEYIWLTL